MAGLRGRALIAYLLVCTVWGSTYLAIRIGVADCPPLLFAGVRFLIAGLILGGIVLATGDHLPRTPARLDDRSPSPASSSCSAATRSWSGRSSSSSRAPASVFVAAVPLWTAFFDALSRRLDPCSPGAWSAASRSASSAARCSPA